MIGPVHRSAIRMTDQFEIVAGSFSSNYDKSLKLAQELGISEQDVYNSYEDMLAENERLQLDAVAIMTPNHLHVAAATAFANKGIHIICEKPLSSNLDGIKQLKTLIEQKNLVFVLTHTYSAYPVIQRSRELIASGKLGNIKMVSVEYLQGWLAELLERDPSNSGAVWRETPSLGGQGGVLGDIGTHAFQLAEFVTGLKVESLLADVSSSPGRDVPDDAKLLLRFNNGATGSLWCSQVAVGALNSLSLRVFGDKGSLTWSHDRHEELHLYDTDNTETVYHKGQSNEGSLPPGHPEGYFEGFAQLYSDFANLIRKQSSRLTTTSASPDIDTGIRGMRFIDTTLKSSHRGGAWLQMP